MDNRRHQRLGKASNQYLSSNLNDFILTFGFVRRSNGDVRAVVDMDYIASDELGNLVRHRFVLVVQFT